MDPHSVELTKPGGVLVVTEFRCKGWWQMVRVLLLHYRVKPDITANVSGFIGVRTVRIWRERRILSISIWERGADLMGMGASNRHVKAAHVTEEVGVTTNAGVFTYSGDWRRLMFGASRGTEPERSPLTPSSTVLRS